MKINHEWGLFNLLCVYREDKLGVNCNRRPVSLVGRAPVC